MNPATEVIHRTDSGTLTFADGHRKKKNLENTLENITSLLDHLHQDSSLQDNAEYTRIQQNMKFLFNTVTSHQMDLLGDLHSVVESFKAGLMSPEQLEMMIKVEQDRSEMILGLASRIGDHLQELFTMIEQIIDHVETGSPLPSEGLGAPLRSQMNLVFESVDSISRIINTPPGNLQQTFDAIEKDIATAESDVQRSRAALSPLMMNSPFKDALSRKGAASTKVESESPDAKVFLKTPISRTTTESRRFNTSPNKAGGNNTPTLGAVRLRAALVDNSSQTDPLFSDDLDDDRSRVVPPLFEMSVSFDNGLGVNNGSSNKEMGYNGGDHEDEQNNDSSFGNYNSSKLNPDFSSRPSTTASSRPQTTSSGRFGVIGADGLAHTGNTRPNSRDVGPSPFPNLNSPRGRTGANDPNKLTQMQHAASGIAKAHSISVTSAHSSAASSGTGHGHSKKHHGSMGATTPDVEDPEKVELKQRVGVLEQRVKELEALNATLIARPKEETAPLSSSRGNFQKVVLKSMKMSKKLSSVPDDGGAGSAADDGSKPAPMLGAAGKRSSSRVNMGASEANSGPAPPEPLDFSPGVEAIATVVPAGSGFKDFEKHVNHPHYHPGATAPTKRQSSFKMAHKDAKQPATEPAPTTHPHPPHQQHAHVHPHHQQPHQHPHQQQHQLPHQQPVQQPALPPLNVNVARSDSPLSDSILHVTHFVTEYHQTHQQKYDECVAHHNSYIESEEFKAMEPQHQELYHQQFKAYQRSYKEHQKLFVVPGHQQLGIGAQSADTFDPTLHLPLSLSSTHSGGGSTHTRPHSRSSTPRSGVDASPLYSHGDSHHQGGHGTSHFAPHMVGYMKGPTPFQLHLQQLQQHPVMHHGHHPVHPHPAHHLHGAASHIGPAGHAAGHGGGHIGGGAAPVEGLDLMGVSVSHAVVHSHSELPQHAPYILHPSAGNPYHPLGPNTGIHVDQTHAQHMHQHGYIPADIPFATKAVHHNAAGGQQGGGVGGAPPSHAPHPLAHQTSHLMHQQSMNVPWNQFGAQQYQQQQQQQLQQQPQQQHGIPVGFGNKKNTLKDVVMKLKKQPQGENAEHPPQQQQQTAAPSKLMSSKFMSGKVADQMMQFAKSIMKMTQETSTDDLEAYIASQNPDANASAPAAVATPPPPMLGQSTKGKSKRGGDLLRGNSIRIPAPMHRGRSTRKLDSAGGLEMGSKAVSPLAFEAIMEASSPTKEAVQGSTSDVVNNPAVVSQKTATSASNKSHHSQGGPPPADDVSACSPLTVDESIGDSDANASTQPTMTTPNVTAAPPSAKGPPTSARSLQNMSNRSSGGNAGTAGLDPEVQSITNTIENSSSESIAQHSMSTRDLLAHSQAVHEAGEQLHHHQHPSLESLDDNTVAQYEHYLTAPKSPMPKPLSPSLQHSHVSTLHTHRQHHHRATPSSRPRTASPEGLHATGTSMLPNLSNPDFYTQELMGKLRQSHNPLQFLFNEFQEVLPDYHKSKLLLAIASCNTHGHADLKPTTPRTHSLLQEFFTSNANLGGAAGTDGGGSSHSSFSQAQKFFADILPLLHKLMVKSSLGITGVEHCEDMLVTTLSLTPAGGMMRDEHTQSLFEKSVQSLYRKIGALEALKVFVEVQLGEYRAIFEGINILSANTFPTLMRSCPEFKECHDLFLKSQGTMVEVGGRIAAVKERCTKANLPAVRSTHKRSRNPLTGSIGSLGGGGSDAEDDLSTIATQTTLHTHTKPGATVGGAAVVVPHLSMPSGGSASTKGSVSASTEAEHPVTNRKLSMMSTKSTKQSVAPFAQELREKSMELEALKKQLDDLKAELAASHTKVEDLEVELVDAHNEKDRTPGALIFYAALSDPFAVSSFQALHDAMITFKRFVNCEEHLDFPTVRKRLKQCLSYLPVVDRFVTRYDLLHKQWSVKRMGTFLERGLGGSAADSAFICPICDCDSRLDPAAQASLGAVPFRLGASPHKVLKPGTQQAPVGATKRSKLVKHGGGGGGLQGHGEDSMQSNMLLLPPMATPPHSSVNSVSSVNSNTLRPPAPSYPVPMVMTFPVPVPMSNTVNVNNTPLMMPVLAPVISSTDGVLMANNITRTGATTIIPVVAAQRSQKQQGAANADVQASSPMFLPAGNAASAHSLDLFSPMRQVRSASLSSNVSDGSGHDHNIYNPLSARSGGSGSGLMAINNGPSQHQ